MLLTKIEKKSNERKEAENKTAPPEQNMSKFFALIY